MELTTERLILREYKADDWPEVLAYQSDPHYLQYYSWENRTAKEVKDFVQMFLNQQQESPRKKFQLAVTLKSSQQLIGSCGLRLDSPDARQADIGYELSPLHWGGGYATEAATAMVHFGFQTHKLHRLWSWCIADNHRSARVLEKLGMQLEGRLRQNEYFKGRWWDTLMYGMLESEWRAQAAQNLRGTDKSAR
jgi:ribosomal-protein-alanine N-acetyltransferase